ncbi:MAG TPA: PEP-CTERM sorting domain-containing protein [Longimicrobiales bacterium]|nr:PEP-CTERM sorting domain-containing protein [Longimicrobiales bacterium]
MRKTMRRRSWLGRLGRLGLPLLLALGIAAPASAVGIFTLDGPVAIDGSISGNPGVRGQFLVVTDFDLSDVLVSNGTVNFATQDVFLVALELFGNSAPVDQVGITVGVDPTFPDLLNNPKGAGALNDVGSGAIAPVSVLADNILDKAGLFDYAPGASNLLQAGETTVRLFVTYAASGGGNSMAIGDSVTFMVSSGTDFSVTGGTIVPEPSTALLLGGGLLALLGAARSLARRR